MNIFTKVRQFVSRDKQRFKTGVYDLDLSYVTERIIGSGAARLLRHALRSEECRRRCCAMFVALLSNACVCVRARLSAVFFSLSRLARVLWHSDVVPGGKRQRRVDVPKFDRR